MKRFLVMSFICLFAIGMSAMSYAAVDAENEVAILSVDGSVKVDTMGDGNWSSAKEGMMLKKGAKIKTGHNATADVVYDTEGLNVMTVSENTTITIGSSMVKLDEGSVLAKFDNLKNGETFSVKTPTAVAGIRGSGLGVDFINGMTVVRAFKDKVYVKGLDAQGNEVGKEVVIPEGWKVEIEKAGEEPTEPAELTENEKAIWDAYLIAMSGEEETETGEVQEEDDDEVYQPEPEIDVNDLSEKKGISPS